MLNIMTIVVELWRLFGHFCILEMLEFFECTADDLALVVMAELVFWATMYFPAVAAAASSAA